MQPHFSAQQTINNLPNNPYQNGITNIGGVQINQNDMKVKVKEHFQNKVMVVDDVDKQIWELVTNVPLVNKHVAIGCGVVNLIFPGIGTIIAACSAQDNVSKAQIMIGILQALLSLLFIGFLLAAYWSYLLITKAMSHENQVTKFASAGNVPQPGLSQQSPSFAGAGVN